MRKFIKVTAVAACFPEDNIDTDQIIPKQFLRRIDKSGLKEAVFYNRRHLADGSPDPACCLNRPGFADVGILVGGRNFGCGSSREHAVWGLLQFGFRAVIAPGFGEIFYSNCFNNGLLAARVSEVDSAALIELLADGEARQIEVDLLRRTISLGSFRCGFDVAPRHREMLLEGLDPIEATLRDLPAIREFQERHERLFPWMARLPAAAKARLREEPR